MMLCRNSILLTRKVWNGATSPRNRKYTLAEAFEIISKNRHAERNFSNKEVDPFTVKKVIELSQSAPSSFNMQPYKIIVIRENVTKEAVMVAMQPGNHNHVQKAAVTFVFLADIGECLFFSCCV
jgi:nitroreductase